MTKCIKGETHVLRVKKVKDLKNRQELLIKIISAVVLSLMLIYLSVTITSAMSKRYEVVTVKRGETLWNIAEKYNEGKDIRKFIRHVSDVNGISPDNIVSGQELMIPVS